MNFGGLTAKQYLLLSQFSYVKVTENPDKAKAEYYGKTLEEIINKILSTPTIADIIAETGMSEEEARQSGTWLDELIVPDNGCFSIGDYKKFLEEIKDDPELSMLTLKAYRNDDGEGKGGFAGYAFEDSKGDTIFAITGTEGLAAEGILYGNDLMSEDWINNVYWGIADSSKQYEPTVEFVEENLGSGNNYITGHSQGGANVIYACGEIQGLTGMVFDAPGISQLLSPVQRKNVEESGLVNYVNINDIVGAL